MNTEDIASLVGADLQEGIRIEYPEVAWRPDLASADGAIAVHRCATDSLGNSIRRRIEAAAGAGRRVVVELPRGVGGLDVDSQRFLLGTQAEIIAPAGAPDAEVKIFGDLRDAVVDAGVVVDDVLARDFAVGRLEHAVLVEGDERGRALEAALAFICSQVPGWRVRDVRFRSSNEEVDLVIANSSARAPWHGSGYVLWEAKNWSGTVDRAEYDAFHMKVKERGGGCRLGFFVAGSGFSSGFYRRAEHHGAEGFSVVPLTAEWLADRIRTGATFEEALEERAESVLLDRRWEE